MSLKSLIFRDVRLTGGSLDGHGRRVNYSDTYDNGVYERARQSDERTGLRLLLNTLFGQTNGLAVRQRPTRLWNR